MLILLRALPDLVRLSVARVVAWRAEMAIWILTTTLPLVMLALWDAVAADGPVAGLGQPEVARYFAATLVVRQLTGAWIAWQLEWEIRTGGLSPRLLRPVNPIAHDAVLTAAAVPFRMLVLTPILALLVLWRPELWAWPGWAGFGLFLVSAALAWALSFLVQVLFGLLSFWLDKSMGLFAVYYSVWALLSGYVAPMALFPAWARGAMDLLPFRGTLAVPVELLGGFLRPADALPDLAVQAGWVVVLGGVAAWAWRAGIRRYGAFGA